jgi:hypothetical protein
MLRVIRDGGIDRHDDLHIDEVDRQWKLRKNWVAGAFESYRVAVTIRDRLNLNISIVLAFALVADSEWAGMEPVNLRDIEAQLAWMPPSIYAFRPGMEFWNQLGSAGARCVLKRLGTSAFADLEPKACYYMEFRNEETDELSRSFFVHA